MPFFPKKYILFPMENEQDKKAPAMGDKLTSDKMKNTGMMKLILQMSVPAILSMLVLSLYNIVDSVFIARYDSRALDALSIAFPMQQLIIAFAVGLAIGTNAYVARKLGQKKYKEATLTAQTGLFIAMCTSLVFVVIALTAARPFMQAFTSDEVTVEYGTTYRIVVMCFSVGSFIDIQCARVLQATGNMIVPMISQIVGAVVNIVLDPLLIFVADMGVLGAAIATVVGQFAAMAIGLIVFKVKRHDVTIFFNKDFRLDGKIIKGILKIGLPTIVMNAVAAFVSVILNLILRAYQAAITVFGIYFKLQSFVFMPIFGLNQGALPVMSYNYGAGDKKRFLEAVKWCLVFALTLMAVGVILFQTIPQYLLAMFQAEGALFETGMMALRIISAGFLFAGVGIIGATTMQALRYGVFSMLISLLQQAIPFLPLAFLFSHFFGVNGVWAAIPVCEFVAATVTVISVPMLIKKCFAHKKPLPPPPEKPAEAGELSETEAPVESL